LWASEHSVATVFDDLRAIAEGCRFRDCAHLGEPGCAVAQAIDEGHITADRVRHFRQLRGEVDALARKRRDRIGCRGQKQLQLRGPKWRE